MTDPTHLCARCDGDGYVGLFEECWTCRGDGECSGALDRNGDCTRCGWCYEPPEPDYDRPSAQEQYEQAARFKREVSHRRR